MDNANKFLDISEQSKKLYSLRFVFVLFGFFAWISFLILATISIFNIHYFNVENFVFLITVVSSLLFSLSSMLTYIHSVNVSFLPKILNAYAVFDSHHNIIEYVRNNAVLYSCPMPNIYFIKSKNINVGSFYANGQYSIVFNDSILERLSCEEINFLISSQFSKISNGYVKYNTNIILSLFYILMPMSFARAILSKKTFLGYFFGSLINFIFMPCIGLFKKIQSIKEKSFNLTVLKVSLVTGIPFDIDFTVKSIQESNKNNPIHKFYSTFLNSFFEFNVENDSLLKNFDKSLSEAYSNELDIGIVYNDIQLDAFIIELLATVKGCISLYYSILLFNTSPPVNLYYTNKTKKIKFDSFMLPFITHEIKQKLTGNIKETTALNLKRDLELMISYTNMPNVENIIACNEISLSINKSYLNRHSMYYGVSRIVDNIFNNSNNEFEKLISSIRVIKKSKSISNVVFHEMKLQIKNKKVNIKLILFLQSLNVYLPVHFAKDS